MPTGGATAGPLEGAERAFQERADLAEAAQGGLAAGSVPIGGYGNTFHIGSIEAYSIRQARNAGRRIKEWGRNGKTLAIQKTTSDRRNRPGLSTRRISNSEPPSSSGVRLRPIRFQSQRPSWATLKRKSRRRRREGLSKRRTRSSSNIVLL